jgi:hypothetical protein
MDTSPTTRLRKTFHYPADDDADDSMPEALDEEGLSRSIQLFYTPKSLSSHPLLNLQLYLSFPPVDPLTNILKPYSEQEHLIQTLNERNTNTNILYTRILLLLPTLSLIPYLPTLFSPQTAFLSLLSISSLLSTAYLLYSLPPGVTSISFLDNLNTTPSTQRLFHRADLIGPLLQYLPYLNLALCGILVLLGMVVSKKVEELWGFGWLPAGVYGVVLLAKWVMGSVDPVSELGGLRYGFKGA